MGNTQPTPLTRDFGAKESSLALVEMASMTLNGAHVNIQSNSEVQSNQAMVSPSDVSLTKNI